MQKDNVHLLIIGSPDATSDLTLQVNLGGPVSLSADRADQHEAIPVRDERLSAIVRPSEVTHLEERYDHLQDIFRTRPSKYSFSACSVISSTSDVLYNLMCIMLGDSRRSVYLCSSVVH